MPSTMSPHGVTDARKKLGSTIEFADDARQMKEITGPVLTFQHSLINFASGIEKLGPDSIYSE
jgi:hypothetical protein